MDALIVSHSSALGAIRYARSRYGSLCWDGLTRSQQRGVLEGCVPHEADLDPEDLERRGIPAAEGRGPVEVLVGSAGARRPGPGLVPHVISRPLPSNSLLRMGPGLYCCSPALAIAQFGEVHRWPEVLALCMELCGGFTLSGGGYLPCDPAVSAQQLVRYLAYAKQIRGLPEARKAARYALDGAASPMEAIVGALYHVPLALGGFGLDELLLNHRMDFSRDAALVSGMPYAVLDAYLPAAQTTLEYNGHDHDTPASRRHDERRTAGLLAMGIQTIPINDEQLRNPDALEAIAKTLYRRMGKRLRYTSSGYRPRQIELLNALRTSMGLAPC